MRDALGKHRCTEKRDVLSVYRWYSGSQSHTTRRGRASCIKTFPNSNTPHTTVTKNSPGNTHKKQKKGAPTREISCRCTDGTLVPRATLRGVAELCELAGLSRQYRWLPSVSRISCQSARRLVSGLWQRNFIRI